MKRLGILGGMSWESTALYYQWINEGIKAELGGLHSADLLVSSVDFFRIEQLQANGDWHQAELELARRASELKAAGAQGLVIATNTMHKVADGITRASGLPLLHIADCTAEVVQQRGLNRVALMGTAFTMEQAFYRERLTDTYGLNVLIPDADERADIHRIIYDELCQGQLNPDSQARLVRIAEHLRLRGAEAVILGCTEITLLLTEEVTDVPLIDTTRIHAQQAVRWMLNREG